MHNAHRHFKVGVSMDKIDIVHDKVRGSTDKIDRVSMECIDLVHRRTILCVYTQSNSCVLKMCVYALCP